jgi:hypothetical protein
MPELEEAQYIAYLGEMDPSHGVQVLHGVIFTDIKIF